MSTPKYTLPSPIYLPSSGGYTSSRLVQEPFHRQVFAFCRWSVDEDGRLVCRTRHAGRDSHPKPYDRPSRPPAFAVPNGQDAYTTSQDHTPKTTIDGPTLSRLFQNLAPLIKEPSSGFDSKAAAICTSLGLDPATSGEIVSSFKKQFVASGNQESSSSNHPPPPGGPSTESAVRPVPTISVTSSVPTRHQRPFSSGPKGYTIWYSTESNEPLPSPPSDLPKSAGILYIHKNLTDGAIQVWMCDIRMDWIEITNTRGAKHPGLADRVFLLRSDGLPSWLTAANYTTIQARKERR